MDINSKLQEMATAFSTKLKAIDTTTSSAFTSIAGTIADKLKSSSTETAAKLQEMATTFSTKLTEINTATSSAFTSIAGTIADKLKSSSTETTAKLQEIASTFDTKLKAADTATSSAFTSIVGTIADKLKSASTDVTAKLGDIASTISTKMSSASSSVSTEAGKWATSIKDGVKAAKDNFGSNFSWGVPSLPSLSQNWGDTVKSGINAVKDQFSGDFSWGVPELKIPIKTPKFKVSGDWGFDDDGNVNSVPKITVEWYRRAAEFGALFNEPTIVGVGDASQPEMLIGEDTLYNSIRAAVMDSTGGGFNQTNNFTVQDNNTAAEAARIIRNQTRQLLARMRGGV